VCADFPGLSLSVVDAGSRGIRANLNKWSAVDFATVKKMVKKYKAVRETVQRGTISPDLASGERVRGG
jgi:hypothetical protein